MPIKCLTSSTLCVVLCLQVVKSSSAPRGQFPPYPPRSDAKGYPSPHADDDNHDDNSDPSYQQDYDRNKYRNWDRSTAIPNKQRENSFPPPPPPPPARRAGTLPGTEATAAGYTPPPIHYKFQQQQQPNAKPSSSGGDKYTRRGGKRLSHEPFDEDGVPFTSLSTDERMRLSQPNDGEEEDSTPAFASPRRDAITLYMDRSIINRWVVRLASGFVGAVIITFVGTSLTTKAWWTVYAWTGFWLFITASWFRNPYGELCRTSGFLLLETIRESRQIRREYPTRPHLRALLGAGPRRPFPPTENPWNYRPSSPDDVAFSMLPAVLAMTVVGSFCGGNIPMVPSWLGALVGAGFLGLLATRPNVRGDLARATGMRVVATVQTLWELQKDLGMTPKVWKVASLLLDKLLILDRQHRLKDKLVAFLSAIYDQVMRLVHQLQLQQQQQQPPSEPSRRGRRRLPPPPPPPEGRRRGPPGDEDRRRGPPRSPRRRSPLDDFEDDQRPRGPRRPRPLYDDEGDYNDFGGRGRMEEDVDVDADDLDGLQSPPPEEPINKKRRSLFGF